LPDDGVLCWAYDKKNKMVFDGQFRKKCPVPDNDFILLSGFCVDEEREAYVYLLDVTHWQPYYTPEPPMDEQ
jgi:hypothetical protein